MTQTAVGTLLRRLRKDLDQSAAAVADAELLERFARERDEAAFELLVWRHQRMVRGVCQRVLRDLHEAEDAFQATFLALARKAASIAQRDAVAGWLYRVACRVSLHARAQRLRITLRADSAAFASVESPDDPPAEVARDDLKSVLDEEVDRLPEKYRLPVILCYLQGESYQEAGRQLGLPLGTIAARLSRARAMLQARLARRGVGFCGAALAVLAGRQAAPAALVHRTVRSAVGSTTGRAVEGLASSRVAALVDEGLRGLSPGRSRIVTAVVLAGLLVAGAGFCATRTPSLAQEPRESTSAPEAKKQPARVDHHGDPLPTRALARLGTVRWRHSDFVSSLVFLPDGKSLISAGEDGIVRLWDGEGRERYRLGQLRANPAIRNDWRAGPAIALSP